MRKPPKYTIAIYTNSLREFLKEYLPKIKTGDVVIFLLQATTKNQNDVGLDAGLPLLGLSIIPHDKTDADLYYQIQHDIKGNIINPFDEFATIQTIDCLDKNNIEDMAWTKVIIIVRSSQLCKLNDRPNENESMVVFESNILPPLNKLGFNKLERDEYDKIPANKINIRNGFKHTVLNCTEVGSKIDYLTKRHEIYQMSCKYSWLGDRKLSTSLKSMELPMVQWFIKNLPLIKRKTLEEDAQNLLVCTGVN